MPTLLIIVLLLFAWPAAAQADSPCTSAEADCVEVGKWQVSLAVGAGVRTNPIMDEANIPLFLLPDVRYTGSRFFLHNLDLGLLLLETDVHQLNLLITPSYEQVYFHRWSPGNFVIDSRMMLTAQPNAGESIDGEDTENNNYGHTRVEVDMSRLHKRRMAALGGLEYSLMLSDWTLQAQWLYDITGIYDGKEARLALARQYRSGRHSLTAAVGITWQSQELINYYYGIRTDEVVLADHAYIAMAGFSQIARIDWLYDLSSRWSLRFTGSYRQLADEIRRSPILVEDQVITVFIGGVYHF